MIQPSPRGLSSDEAERLLVEVGPNAVTEPRISPLTRVARRLWEPVPWMLEAAIILQFAIGEYTEAGIITALLVFNVALGWFQEQRADAALVALKRKLALKAYVKRDGTWSEIPAASLVPGDVVRLSLGSIVPADARIIDGSVLLDQSMLTGESVPVEIAPPGIAYGGALVRRGGATAVIAATGERTYFGRTAELVRIAHVESGEQKAVLGVVRNLAVFNGAIVVALVGYAHSIAMPVGHIIPLVLTALLASIPVALPATFTLAAALGAQALTKRGVLLTRLSAIHEAATVDVLCADKTGTLTRNELVVAAVEPLNEGVTKDDVLVLAVLASSESGDNPVDSAIRAAVRGRTSSMSGAKVLRFIPFDPATKISEAEVVDQTARKQRVVKGAPAAVEPLTTRPHSAALESSALAREGFRVLAVAAGPAEAMVLVGLVGLTDPPRPDSKELIGELRSMGVRTIMVTGDAAETASAIAFKVGLDGATCPRGKMPDDVGPEDFAVYAGVFPEDKFRLVKAFQRGGHTVAMCGDGANDAPALRQAQMGIAISSATDIAKSAASIVLTEPGLDGIVSAIEEGRSAFQRILTYALNTLIKKFELVPFLGTGLLLTQHAVLTPMLMALLLVTGDFLTMSLTTDKATPSQTPDAWRVRNITAAAAILGLFNLVFSVAVLVIGKYQWGLHIGELRTLAFVALVFGSQATIYVIRERRRMWGSFPSIWLVLSTILDLGIASFLAATGILTPALSLSIIVLVLLGAIVFSLALDLVKGAVFAQLQIP